MSKTMSAMQKEWLQLIHIKGLTVAAKRVLVTALGSPGAVLRADSETVEGVLRAAAGEWEARGKGAKLSKAPKMTYPDVDADLAALERIGGGFIGFNEADFPPLLNQIDSPPLGLFVRGERALLVSPQLAIVGSRSPTPAGRRTTEQFAAALCATGLTITSGMARGIDSSAHRGCLDVGGKTVAVVATGIDVVYPRSNEGLSREIAGRGLIVSEYPPGAPPRREYFPQRNRIISGLSLGTLVVEAGIRSGSLITARLAGEQGREVFAVPGSIHVPVSRGCHHLLRQGAKLVESTDDILEEIGQFFSARARSDVDGGGVDKPSKIKSNTEPKPESKSKPTPKSTPPGKLSPLYDLIDYTPVSIDQLIEQSGLTADQVSYILMELELKGLIAAATGGYQRLPKP